MDKAVFFDFDGVIHSYSSGWLGRCEIPDPPVMFEDGSSSIDMLRDFLNSDYETVIYTRRCGTDDENFGDGTTAADGVAAVQEWLYIHGLAPEEINQLTFQLGKPHAHIVIDDRVVTFQGRRILPAEAEAFTPWFRRDYEMPRRFVLRRNEDETGVSGTGPVACGTQYASGKCTLAWNTAVSSIAIYDSIGELEQIHGHEGRTVIEWID